MRDHSREESGGNTDVGGASRREPDASVRSRVSAWGCCEHACRLVGGIGRVGVSVRGTCESQSGVFESSINEQVSVLQTEIRQLKQVRESHHLVSRKPYFLYGVH